MSIDLWRERFESTPYVQRLGCELAGFEPDEVRLELPFREANSNPGGALHGGVHASLLGCAGLLAAQSRLEEPESLEVGLLDLSVVYLAAAVSEPVRAVGRVLRRGREIIFAEAGVENAAGRLLARGLVTVRAVNRETAARAAEGDPMPRGQDPHAFIEGPLDPGPMGRALSKSPFMGSLMQIEHMGGGQARLAMPAAPAVLDHDGGHHPGALAALLDSAGAMASWTLVTPGMHKAMTPGLQMSFTGSSAGEDVYALAQNRSKRAETFLNRVEVVTASGAPVATGLLTYRIVVGPTKPR